MGNEHLINEHRSKIFIRIENRGPVGTNYSKVIPAKEINFKDRDSFWKKEEEEERKRVEVEKDRRQQELQKGEEVCIKIFLSLFVR